MHSLYKVKGINMNYGKKYNSVFGLCFVGNKFSKSILENISIFLPDFISWLKSNGDKNSKNSKNCLNIDEFTSTILEYKLTNKYEEILNEWINFLKKYKNFKISEFTKEDIIKLFQISCPKFGLDVLFLEECLVCKNSFLKTKALSNKKYCNTECLNLAEQIRQQGNKFLILSRDNYRCIYCGSTPILDQIKLTLDHITPFSKGGLETADNLVTCCIECNLSKHDNILNDNSLKEIQEEIYKRNINHKIPNKKIIKGSHERSNHKIKERDNNILFNNKLC